LAPAKKKRKTSPYAVRRWKKGKKGGKSSDEAAFATKWTSSYAAGEFCREGEKGRRTGFPTYYRTPRKKKKKAQGTRRVQKYFLRKVKKHQPRKKKTQNHESEFTDEGEKSQKKRG